jgi:hypothetical protein
LQQSEEVVVPVAASIDEATSLAAEDEGRFEERMSLKSEGKEGSPICGVRADVAPEGAQRVYPVLQESRSRRDAAVNGSSTVRMRDWGRILVAWLMVRCLKTGILEEIPTLRMKRRNSGMVNLKERKIERQRNEIFGRLQLN